MRIILDINVATLQNLSCLHCIKLEDRSSDNYLFLYVFQIFVVKVEKKDTIEFPQHEY